MTREIVLSQLADTIVSLQRSHPLRVAIDGFLLRPELNALWDYRIFVHVDFEVALQRAMGRDEALFGSHGAVEARYLQRYFPGQRLYFQAVGPQQRAGVVVENNDPAQPQLIFSD